MIDEQVRRMHWVPYCRALTYILRVRANYFSQYRSKVCRNNLYMLVVQFWGGLVTTYTFVSSPERDALCAVTAPECLSTRRHQNFEHYKGKIRVIIQIFRQVHMIFAAKRCWLGIVWIKYWQVLEHFFESSQYLTAWTISLRGTSSAVAS